MTLIEALHAVVEMQSLTEAQAEAAMGVILAGESTPVLTAAFLTALRLKGETVQELAGCARAMRAVSTRVPLDPAVRPLLDTCGTGGGGIPTFNISTTVAFVVAGAGVKVAKHGNRSITSKCGSADVLEALGVRTRATPEEVASSIEQVGIGFLFAPAFHGAMKHVQPIRLELKFRTIFNYLGPLTNPAGAEMQLVGTGSEATAAKLADTLARLGLHSGFVVRGHDGLGEVTVTGPTSIYRIANGKVEKQIVEPVDFGFETHPAATLLGGDPETNRTMVEAVLAGQKGAPREVVLMTAALALIATGKALDFKHGVALAAESIDSGAAGAKLRALAAHLR